MNYMEIYKSLSTPPNDAVKSIKGGNLKGFSDINPQWRYEALTNQFGLCGAGWKYSVDDWFTQEVPNGEMMIFVKVSLFINHEGKWLDPIPAFGGDYLVKKDRNGIHGNDEAMKMAITDALGTAMKMIGVAADVYRGLIANGASDSKYARRDYVAQTAQNGAGRTQNAKPNNYKGNAQNNATNGNDAIRARAIKSLNAEINRIGVTGQKVAAIAGVKFGKTSIKDMSTNEICDLGINLETWIMEQSA